MAVKGGWGVPSPYSNVGREDGRGILMYSYGGRVQTAPTEREAVSLQVRGRLRVLLHQLPENHLCSMLPGTRY